MHHILQCVITSPTVITYLCLCWVCCMHLTCVRADVLDVVALAVREVGALAAGVQFAGEVVPQVFPPVVLTDGGVRTQSALKHPVWTNKDTLVMMLHMLGSMGPVLVRYLWSSPSLL